MVVADKLVDVLTQTHHGSDVAAWTLRGGNGVVNWRDAGLEDHSAISDWAIRALAHGHCYADLLYSELAALEQAK